MLDVVLARDFKANDGDVRTPTSPSHATRTKPLPNSEPVQAVIELIPGFDLMNHDEDPNINYVKSGSSSRTAPVSRAYAHLAQCSSRRVATLNLVKRYALRDTDIRLPY